MAQRSHVPKFGNWEGDNVPYTAYFENARKEKGSGMRINPNDPEQNPEAFMFGGGGPTTHGSSPLHINSDKSVSVENYQIDRKNVGQKSMTSKSGSDRSIYDYSSRKTNHRCTRSSKKKSVTEVNNIFCPPSPEPYSLRRGFNPADDDISSRSASVPMFGAWDEKDPKSGEGFTVIFNKVKEEKQIAASRFPVVPMQSSNQTNNAKNNTQSKRWWCLC